MKIFSALLLVFTTMILLSACTSGVDRFDVLKKCMVLGDESVIYARAHYVKLFYHYNPKKFSDSYKQVEDFDAVTHKNTIDTYIRAIDKLITDKRTISDSTTQNLLSACKSLSTFSINFVEQNYHLALNHQSKNDPLTDDFFIEINKIVMFDHKIGAFDNNKTSFKQRVDDYQSAVNDYIKTYRKNIPTKFIEERSSK